LTGHLELADLTACGAHQHGHFRLSSGLHSGDYLQCALYLAHPRRAARTGALLAGALLEIGAEAEVVVAPALGGLIIGYTVAAALDRPFLFTERSEGRMALRRGFGFAPGQRVVIVEDVVTTGRSTREVVDVVEAAGAKVVAMAAVVNRSGRANPFDPLPFVALLETAFPTWDPAECPLCRAGEPVAKPGSRPV